MTEMLAGMSRLLERFPSLIRDFEAFLPHGMTFSTIAKISHMDTSLSVNCEGTLVNKPASSLFVHSSGEIAPYDSPHITDVSRKDLKKEEGSMDACTKHAVDEGLAGISKYGTYKEFKFFEKVRQLMGNDDTYLNFLRCLMLFTKDIVTGSELVDILQPFLIKELELASQLRSMLGCGTSSLETCVVPRMPNQKTLESLMEIDYSSCKKYGFSYRPLPSSYDQPVCTGRTFPGNEVCDEVLNDTWVSFPLWSEDFSFGNSKISQYEEFVYRCEDERFELDIVIDSIASTVQVLEDVRIKLSKLSPEEANSYQLDHNLGGSSEVLQRKSIERIYGDKASDMIEGLMRKPYIAIPIVLNRLKSKVEEWSEARKNFNKVWREEHEKQYVKWLQSQATTYRQFDARQMRTKTLLNEAEVAAEETFGDRVCCRSRHQEFIFSSCADLKDATNLIIHYLSYLPTVQTDDSFRISQILNNTLPQVIGLPTSQTKEHLEQESKGETYTVMFANSSWYLFLRMLHMFCKRIEEIRRHCDDLQKTGRTAELTSRNGAKTYSCYEYVISMIKLMIEGVVEVYSYESDMLKVLGSNAYITFTVEKILHNIFKQLQHVVSDDVSKQLISMFSEEAERGAAGGSVSTAHRRQIAEAAYRRRALRLTNDEYCFKITFFKLSGRVTMELVDTEVDTIADDQLYNHYRWSDYIEQYLSPTKAFSETTAGSVKPVFLARNMQRQLVSTADQSRVATDDHTRCLLSSNSYKVTFVQGSSSFFYRPKSRGITRKRYRWQSCNRKKKFFKWWKNWQSLNITNDQERRISEWISRTSSRGFRK